MATVVCCRGGGTLIRANGSATVKGVTYHVWRALECITANRLGEEEWLMKTKPWGEACAKLWREVCPSVIIGDACHKSHEPRPGVAGTTSRSTVGGIIG